MTGQTCLKCCGTKIVIMKDNPSTTEWWTLLLCATCAIKYQMWFKENHPELNWVESTEFKNMKYFKEWVQTPDTLVFR